MMKKRWLSFFMSFVIIISTFLEPAFVMGMETEIITEKESFIEQESEEILETTASSASFNEPPNIKETSEIEETEEAIDYSEEKIKTTLNSGKHEVSIAEDGRSVKFTLNDARLQGVMYQLAFMVWSAKDGQDDIRAYADESDDGIFTATMPLYNHKDIGTYHVHAYFRGTDGALHFVKAFTFEVDEFPKSETKVVSMDEVNGTFNVNTYIHIQKDLYEKVFVEAWTTSNKSDLYLYEGKIQSDGTYNVQVDVKNHAYHIGEYKLQCYVVNAKGERINVAETSIELKMNAGVFEASLTSSGYSMELALNDVETQGIANKLAFMVWSNKNGKDDIKSYIAAKSGNTYTALVPLYNHKDIGIYQVHVYISGMDGKLHFLKAETFEVTEMPEEGIEISNIKEDKGSFDVDVYLARDSQTISSVCAYVWTRADRSDFTCYAAKKQEDGSYKVSVDARKHQWFSGTYQIHVYTQDIKGKLTFIDSNPVKLSLGTRVDAEIIDAYSARVIIWGVQSDVISVKFPTWDMVNGVGAAYWYEGKKNTDGSWSAEVHTANHKTAGKFISHIYAYTKSGSTYLDQATFNIEKKWEGRIIDPNKPMVALTFDDGPSGYTPRVLDALEKYDQAATFFVVGYNAARYGSTMKRMLDIGCEIGNHTYNHPDLTQLSYSSIVNEMSMTNSKIYAATGTYATVSRTPGGSVNSTVRSAISTPIIMWSIDTLDWKTRDTWSTVNSVLNNVEDGDIVLMHDIHAPTISAAEILIPKLVERGYQLVTVSELAKYRGNGMKAGKVYYSFK